MRLRLPRIIIGTRVVIARPSHDSGIKRGEIRERKRKWMGRKGKE